MSNGKRVIIGILQQIALFEGLNTSALKNLIQISREKSYAQGDLIFEEDSLGNSMMIIVSGEVRISQITAHHSEEALCVLKTGDFFGEMGLLENRPRSASAIANTDAYILEIDRNHFLDYVHTFPREGVVILLNLANKLSSRLREADNKIRAFINLAQWI